jgi:Bacterial SH3 domain
MMFHRKLLPIALRVQAMVLLVFCASAVHGASAVLSGLEIVGGPKGVALTLRADAPFPIKMEERASSKNSGQVLIAVHCTNVIYGLEDFEFATFPRGCPVSRIAVSESPAGNSVDMVIAVSGSLGRPAISKQKETKWIVLLSRDPAPTFSWSAVPQTRPAAAPSVRQEPAARQTGLSRLNDISVLARDNVELITFKFDGPTAMRFKRDKDKIVVLFVNATSGLAATRFSPSNDPASAVELKQIAHGGTMWLGASVFMTAPELQSAVMQAFSDRLVIYTVRDSLQRLSLWSAAKGQTVNYGFVKLPRFAVDIEGMKKKAVTDLSGNLQKSKTFAIREEPPARPSAAPQQKAAIPAAAVPVKQAPPAVRLVVANNDAGLRSNPSAGNNVIARLPVGTVTTLVQKKQEWTKVRAGDTTGWVASSMVVDSARASRAMLDKIDKAVKARLAQQKAAEEKTAREIAAKEKAEQEKLAKQKLAADREAQKKSALAAKAAARDSASRSAQKKAALEAKAVSVRDSGVQYATAVQESVQTQAAKNITARKQVEYHVYGRDPFLPLTGDEDTKVKNVKDLTLVGILYDQADRIALFETPKGNEKAVALRENDPVQNGYVLRIQPDKVLFLLNELGISRTYALKLFKENKK